MKSLQSWPVGVASLVVVVASAEATPDFPGATRTHLVLSTTPECILCHATPAGGSGSATRPFGMTLRGFGVTAFNGAALRAALDRIVAEAVDNNGNGSDDVEDLKAGRNPNVAEGATGGQTDENPCDIPVGEVLPAPRYGCSSRQEPRGFGGLSLLGFLVVLLTVRGWLRRGVKWCGLALFTLLLASCSQESDAPLGECRPSSSDAGVMVAADAGTTTSSSTGNNVCTVAERVLISRCSGCHSAGGLFPDLTLEGAKRLVDLPSLINPNARLVVPDDPDASLLFRKIAGTQRANEGERMPQGTVLDDPSIELVRAWIAGGAVTDCTATGTTTQPERYHPEGWVAPTEHGLALKMGEQDCRNCHGADLTGGTGPSCDTCHTQGWRTSCTFCHGGQDDASGAPPRDLSGETVLAALRFRAHTPHRQDDTHAPFDCTQCHQKPTNVLSLAHVFDDTPGVAEVRFDRGHASQGVFRGNGQCSNLYCHGNGNGRLGSADDTRPPICGDCHAGPNGSRAEWDTMSGLHEDHLREGIACGNCHAGTANGETLVRGTQHVNGVKDVVFAVGLNMVRTAAGCTGTCHGEGHNTRNWSGDD